MNKKHYPNIGETVYSETLENGLRVFLIPKPGFVSSYASITVRYGGAFRTFSVDGKEYDTPAGIAHFLEHKMFDMPDGSDAMTALTALGAEPNAFTAPDMTCYYFSASGNFYDCLKILLSYVSTPYFTEATVAKEQGIIGQEIMMGEDSPGLKLYYGLIGMLYHNHPLKDKVIGTVDSISEITPETLYSCHDAFYRCSNMVLCAEGDFDPEAVLELIKSSLSPEMRETPLVSFGASDGVLPYETRRTLEAEISSTQFMIGAKFEHPGYGSSQLRTEYVAFLALQALLGQSSPLYTSMYSEGIINKDFSFETDFTLGTGTVIIEGESRSPELVFERITNTAASVSASGLDNSVFTRCKKSYIGTKLRSLESFENTCYMQASGILYGYDNFENESLIEEITIEECEEFISTVLVPERIALAVLTPIKEG